MLLEDDHRSVGCHEPLGRVQLTETSITAEDQNSLSPLQRMDAMPSGVNSLDRSEVPRADHPTHARHHPASPQLAAWRVTIQVPESTVHHQEECRA